MDIVICLGFIYAPDLLDWAEYRAHLIRWRWRHFSFRQ